MKEVRIEANSNICDYCKYYYISDKIIQSRMCCACSPTTDDFSGIECIKLTDEKEKHIYLKELRDLLAELNNITKEDLIILLAELNNITKEDLIIFIVENNTTADIKEYIAMKKDFNAKKGEE